ncbi:MupA/Atu3671 family FMN-dependent luciferase-like monooxygenase [Dolichospermum circinale]|uniref:MupA/Atu3671 family FMN-dependent luciferase-like monooxygenase n=1 Tax=Dolichospermum circinale TaxID=109265 RepID=UPI0023309F43|nr:MupA/Atu3671 family FMN-dependent luciferase-like monooxygenase [Dolichospermum circinale]MDB9465988.1 LLM class flavin-dependent oxidoreductase [Dolichospermum circinale CS-539/09]MDB9471048.1 LLM class flavin-dependent oxidoreductase [Dolichospermum circinale CS-539]
MTGFCCFAVGNGNLSINCLELLLLKNCQLLGVYSPDNSLQAWCESHAIEYISSRNLFHKRLLSVEYDYLFSINNVQWIIPKNVIARAKKATINYHDAPLPKYAGLYATSWALLNGETEHAVTWHQVVHSPKKDFIDAGPIFKQKIVPIRPDDTAFTLNISCFDAAIASFDELTAELIAGNVEPIPQDLSQRTYFGYEHRPISLISYDVSSKDICNLVRALDFGPVWLGQAGYRNELGQPKIWLPGGVVVVGSARPIISEHGTPGQVLILNAEGISIATIDGAVEFGNLKTLNGKDISHQELQQYYGVRVGDVLPVINAETKKAISQRNIALSRYEQFWVERLTKFTPFQHPYLGREISHQLPEFSSPQLQRYRILSNAPVEPKNLLVMFAAYCVRLAAESSGEFDLGLQTQFQRGFTPELFSQIVPFRVNFEKEVSFRDFQGRLSADLNYINNLGSFRHTLLGRYPELHDTEYGRNLFCRGNSPWLPKIFPVAIASVPAPDALKDLADWDFMNASMAFVAYEDGSDSELVHRGELSDADSRQIVQQLEVFISACLEHPDQSLDKLPILNLSQQQQILEEWNQTAQPFPADKCIHDLVLQQVERTPDAIAVVFQEAQLTYRELNTQANQLAHYLILQGVGPDVLVGLLMERSLEMMIGLLAIHKAGGAYLPLDPDFPQERLAFMVEDSQAPIILTNLAATREDCPTREMGNLRIIPIDAIRAEISQQPTTNPHTEVKPENLSYVIYTSGSTGKPKGVMVEHRNVVNFFTGMDAVINHEPPGVWLAVTSLSFDISVLELLWTLARGFKVVIYDPKAERKPATSASLKQQNRSKSIDFSLFYFSSHEKGEDAADKYRLLLEGAKFADTHGFKAVWTPERHFHAFGGLFPNPVVSSAAIATITKDIQIRAGSCVSPLHNTIRLAEDWSLVDNLSNGRVGISFAAGWQPNDFALYPDRFANRKEIMFEQIEEVQALWRGESLELTNGKGERFFVQTLPRPVQPTLPIWITAAGNPETFREAGAKGFNILTHLLGQSLEELAAKIAIYRQAYAENGHSGEGIVSLMIHTYVGESKEEVKELVRQPMRQYLASSLDLIKLAAWSFPTFKQKTTNEKGQFSVSHLSDPDMNEVLDFSFERYFETSSLFGTVDTCVQMVDRIKAIGVNEIACLIDYGVDTDTVLSQLPLLNELKARIASQPTTESVADLIKSHQVTHLQSTPSMASLLIADTPNRQALSQLSNLMIGGEAFTEALAKELQQIIPGQIHNMYGPTETTVWSATHTLAQVNGVVPLGRPIANTELYVLDNNQQPVPVGMAGELYIGGVGVTRGYLNRPELTQSRFIPHPFSRDTNARLYRTGDLVRYRRDGILDFLGRIDFQVKIRGYRIELGEIETILSRHEAVQEAVIIVREDIPGDKRLVAYISNQDNNQCHASMREYLLSHLPEYMVPSNFVVLEKFPLTPNHKVDRKALPAPMLAPVTGDTVSTIIPQNHVEQTLIEIWQKVLQISTVGTQDSFFDLGGNSLVAVRLIGEIRSVFNVDLPLIKLFQFPTIIDISGQIMANSANQFTPLGQICANKSRDEKVEIVGICG